MGFTRSAHSGAETLSCGSTVNPSDGSFGFELRASYDTVKNLTFEDCDIGVASVGQISGSTATGVRSDAVLNDWFNGDYAAVVSEYGYARRVPPEAAHCAG